MEDFFPRWGCELHGALRTVEAISGAVPVVHANAGCVYQAYLAGRAEQLACGRVHGPETPATEVIEKQIVFGGASRLREELKNAAKVFGAGKNLYVVLGSCEAAMVGDDLAAMTREALEAGIPAAYYGSAGFRCAVHGGYAGVMSALFKQIPDFARFFPGEGEGQKPGLVNVLGILPGTDIFYKGDLLEMRRLLEAAGLEPNLFFGPRNGVTALLRAARAQRSLVFSRWGLEPARELEARYGVPYTVFDSLPLGVPQTRAFFERLTPLLPVDRENLAAFLDREEEDWRFLLYSMADAYYREGLQRRAALVGDAALSARLGPFLSEELGTVVEAVLVTDGPAPSVPEAEAIAGVDMILGSALEAPLARKMAVPHLIVSSPNAGQIPLHKTYAGPRGALFFLEDFAAAVLRGAP